MKTVSKSKIELIAQLYKIREEQKGLEKAEKFIKDQIKALMGSDLVLEAGPYVVSQSPRQRHDLDKKAILDDLGPAFFKKYEKMSVYLILNVTKGKSDE